MYSQEPGPLLPSLVQDLHQLLHSPSPALMSTELSCLEEGKENIYKESVISTLLTSGQWYSIANVHKNLMSMYARIHFRPAPCVVSVIVPMQLLRCM